MTAEFDRTAIPPVLAALEAHRLEIGHRRIVERPKARLGIGERGLKAR